MRSICCSATIAAARISAERRKIDPDWSAAFDGFGISGLANIVAAIKLAKHLDYGPNDVVMTVATDSAAMYAQRTRDLSGAEISGRFRRGQCRRDFRAAYRGHRRRSRPGAHASRPQPHFQSRLLHLGRTAGRLDRGFRRRRKQDFWQDLVDTIPAWDRLIEDFNAEIGRNGRHEQTHVSDVKPYEKLRSDLAQRDRSLREKVVSLEDVASFVRDGDTVGIGGSTMSRTPMALIWALIRAGTQETDLRAQHHFKRRRSAVRLGRLRAHRYQLVQPGHPVGRLQGDAPSRRDRQGALRRMEPSGHGHAASRRRHGRAVHARSGSMLGSDVLQPAARSQGDGLPVHRRKAAARAGAQSRRGADPRAALRRLRQRADRRPAIHGHRPRDGGQQGHPDDRARSSPTIRSGALPTRRRFRSSRSMPWSKCRSAARRTSATASMNR